MEDKPKGSALTLELPHLVHAYAQAASETQVIEIAAPVVAALHCRQGHPRATLLYLRLLTLPPSYWTARTQLHFATEQARWEVARDYEAWQRVATALAQSGTAWGALDARWRWYLTRTALFAEPGWAHLLTGTLAHLQRTVDGALPLEVEAAVRRLWESEAWTDTLSDLLAAELLALPGVPPLPPARLIQSHMAGVTWAEVQVEWEWLEAQGALACERNEQGLWVTLDPQCLWPTTEPKQPRGRP